MPQSPNVAHELSVLSAWERDEEAAPEDSSIERQEYLRVRQVACAGVQKDDVDSEWNCEEE